MGHHLSAGKADREQEADPLGAAEAAREDLPSPDGPIGAEAAVVVDRADDDRRHLVVRVLGEDRRDVRVVVLHLEAGGGGARVREPGGCVGRMGVAGDDLRLDARLLNSTLDIGPQHLGRRAVRIYVGLVAGGEAERAAQSRSVGEHRAARGYREADPHRLAHGQ